MATEGLTKPDCARLQREAFGILVGSLSQDDALALQAALRARGIETEVVDESFLPVLTEPKRGHALKLAETYRTRASRLYSRPAAACCISRIFRTRN